MVDEASKRRLKDQIDDLNNCLTRDIIESNNLKEDLNKLEATIRTKESELEERRL